jgi:hypothetical protein
LKSSAEVGVVVAVLPNGQRVRAVMAAQVAFLAAAAAAVVPQRLRLELAAV